MTQEKMKPTKSTIACARCDKTLENIYEGAVNQPSGAASFTSHGHYGSNFDPMSSIFLEINICDDCLDVLSERKQALLGQPVRVVREDPSYSYWNSKSFDEED